MIAAQEEHLLNTRIARPPCPFCRDRRPRTLVQFDPSRTAKKGIRFRRISIIFCDMKHRRDQIGQFATVEYDDFLFHGEKNVIWLFLGKSWLFGLNSWPFHFES